MSSAHDIPMAKNTTKEPKEPGRPSSYRDEYAEQARKLCLLGYTDIELAEFFSVCEKTINNWKTDFPEFLQSITCGKAIADAEVADGLYQRARGYSHPDVHVSSYEGCITITPITKHYPPDTPAASLWLRNRQSKKWRKEPDGFDEDVPVAPVKIVVEVKDARAPDART